MKKTKKLWPFITGSFLCVQGLIACQSIDELLDVRPEGVDVVISEPGKVKFVAIGDTGKGNADQFKVAEVIKTKCEQDGCDFVMVLGDNIYGDGVDSVGDPQFKTKFEDPYKNISLPFYMVLGNHDYGGDGAGYELQKSIYQVQYTEKSTKWIMPAHYYKFKADNATFFALDTNAQVFNLANEQSSDVSKWIAQSDTTWKIAFGHHPYKSNGRHGNAGSYDSVPGGVELVGGEGVKKFAESVWCGKVDVYLSGHDHNRQWLDTSCDDTALVVSGAGATTTPLPGSNPVLFQADTLGILYIAIDGKVLTAEFVDENGNVEFSHTLRKP
ncbi:metallophosphoesterase [Kaarinaea lacus]